MIKVRKRKTKNNTRHGRIINKAFIEYANKRLFKYARL